MQLQQLVLGYQQPLTNPINWRVAAGERWALIGPNGSGKSLLLKTLSGQLSPLGGNLVWSSGVRWVYLAQEHPRPSLWPLSGRDWLGAMGVQPATLPLIEHLVDRRLDQLSGGQWQLLRLASVLGSQAEVILLDEPSNHLDVQVRSQSLALLARLQPHQSLVMAGHDQDFIQASGALEYRMELLQHAS
ncbi:ABC transporter related protein [Desulfurivibrio alkaliphilus AHT 2]|uniref:ABC transporter related protein n=1 Tax=Desulfurivibrio alkaliphilus (strain DSM 19089 / UNIQEM U267 / AHT2) TaxID=589865 RepID=D6Z138_DESAT|nr:ABC transporter related protein [Desulfurivibrio alkaliphilus AHT 2]